jgi:hypothetical protein
MRKSNVTKKGSQNDKPGSVNEKLVFANVILRSGSGKSVLQAGPEIRPHNIKEYLPLQSTLEQARKHLLELGFEITLAAPTHITIKGPKELFEKVFQVRLTRKFASYFEPSRKQDKKQAYYESEAPAKIPPDLTKLIEAVEFPGPVTYYIDPTPPPLAYDHMEVPDDVARDMDALKAHARGIDGAGIHLAMVDSGFMMPLHPYYVGKGYNIQPLSPDPDDPSPNSDLVGHGTAIASCALAVAPGITFTFFKSYGSNMVPSFSRAVAATPHIITCSWGVPFSAALQLAVNNAVASGIVVFFACGNNGPVGWPGSEPAVISVGGAFIGNDDSIQAASHASSGTNGINPGRQCPDLCGIAGMAPKGVLIALPTQQGSYLDSSLAGGVYPANDTTAADDGWLVASGTSSAAPMVAATAALVMQANPAAVGNPALVRTTLISSCIDVATGNSSSGQAAGPGPDLATGAGLVQAYRAVRATDLWIKDNPDSDIGLVPSHNRRPAWPPFAHWASPDIKVFSAPLADPAADFDPTPNENPVFNQDNYVYIRVRNRGTQPTGLVNAQLYYADPATNLVFPADWQDGQSGIPGQGSIQVGGVGTNLQTFPSVAAGGHNVLPQAFIWRPPDPTTATQTQTLTDGRVIGHFCLLVRLDSVDDPIIHAGGGQSSVVNDNNLGMANQQVYSAPPGHMFFFTFFVRGGTEKEGVTTNELLFDLSKLPRRSLVIMQMDRRQTDDARLVNAKRTNDGIRLNVGKKPAGFSKLTLKAGLKTLAKVAVQMPTSAALGDYPADVFQSSKGKALGGVRLVARVRK